IDGYFEGGASVTGTFTGTLRWGPLAAGASPPAGALPTPRLLWGCRERNGGNGAGGRAHYVPRPSLSSCLQLSAVGTSRTQQGAGRFSREGAAIRLASGPWAGALGRLEPDDSGEPAVYFEREDNRRADGTPIVDPYRTFCVSQR